MALNAAPVYLSTFLLERNRWNGKGPSLLVSDWVEPIAEAGFQGLEIWQPHLFFSSRSEWEAIRNKCRDADFPVAFLYSPLPPDASDKSARLRESLLEAADYFSPQGVRLALAGTGGDDEARASFVAGWSRDLPGGVEAVCAWEETGRTLESIHVYRIKLGERFRCSLNPFGAGFEGEFLEAGAKAVVQLSAGISMEGKCLALRDAPEACARAVELASRLNFRGVWTLECTSGMGEAGENMDVLFDEAEEDLHFLRGAFSRK